MILKSALLAIATLLLAANAQIDHLGDPIPIGLAAVPPLGPGNAVEISPDQKMVVATSGDGTLTAFDSQNIGNGVLWSFKPSNIPGLPLFCRSGAVFGSTPELGDYVIHAVSDGLVQADPSSCRVFALNLTGSVLWESQSLEGACSGTPVISSDGAYVFLTHNLVVIGHFTILRANINGTALFQSLDPVQPFSPPGIFHKPEVGYYEGGVEQNDVLVWSYRPFFNETGVGNAFTFAFQFPDGFDGMPVSLGVRTLNNVTWQSISPPKLTNNGYSMYYGVSRSQFRAWNGAPGVRQRQFDRLASARRGYPRGSPVWQAVYASPALSSDPMEPMVFGGTADNLFVAMTYNLTEMWNFTTTTTIRCEARVSPDDLVVYFVENNGMAHGMNISDGTEIWRRSVNFAPIQSNFAMSSDGKTLYFGDMAGNMVQWQVAIPPTQAPSVSPLPSASPSKRPSRAPSPPTAFPSGYPSASPSMAPSATESTVPSQIPSTVPSSAPTRAASNMPSMMPTRVASDGPSVEPTSTPRPSGITLSPSERPTNIASMEPSNTPSDTLVVTPMPTLDSNTMPNATPIPTPEPNTPNAMPNTTPAPNAMPSATPAPNTVPSATPAPNAMPSATPAPNVMPSATPAPNAMPSVTSAPNAMPSVTSAPNAIPSITPAPNTMPSATSAPNTMPSATPAPNAMPSATSAPNAMPSATPAPNVMPSATSAPNAMPSATPAPNAMPAAMPNTIPTPAPNAMPAAVPNTMPTPAPNAMPAATPMPTPEIDGVQTPMPTPEIDGVQTPMPTPAPNATPMPTPTLGATFAPSTEPSNLSPSTMPVQVNPLGSGATSMYIALSALVVVAGTLLLLA